MGWLTGWTYRKSITLSRASGAVINYQMKLLVGEAGGTGNDADTVSLLHMQGTDESVVFTDDAVGGSHVWTPSGTAKIDSAAQKFGACSGIFDGNSDMITAPDSADWDYGTDDVTIDFWVKFSDNTTYQTLYSQRYVGGILNGRMEIFYYGALDNSIRWTATNSVGTTNMYYATQTGISDTDWHHIALVRQGANIYIFFDGVSQALTAITAINASTSFGGANGLLRIGNYDGGAYWFAGNLQEYRISKVARWTSNFTPPTAPYGRYWKSENVSCEGNVLSSFSDLRFTNSNGETLLDYWIESITGTTPNQLATVWIKFDSIGTGDTTFYMYYGKADAAVYSDGDNTFLAFDDFEDDTIGVIPSGWSETENAANGTCLTIAGGYIGQGVEAVSTVTTYRAEKTGLTLGTQYCIEARIKFAGNSGEIVSWDSGVGYVGGIRKSASYANFRYLDSAGWSDVGVAKDANWHKVKMFVYDTNKIDYHFDATALTNKTTINSNQEADGYGCRFQEIGTVDVDQIFVRNYRATEPAWGSWGSEETESGGGNTSAFFQLF